MQEFSHTLKDSSRVHDVLRFVRALASAGETLEDITSEREGTTITMRWQTEWRGEWEGKPFLEPYDLKVTFAFSRSAATVHVAVDGPGQRRIGDAIRAYVTGL
jgi:hypothetical protein